MKAAMWVMMDFISIPVTTGIVFFGIYKLFELFVKKRERLLLIDKLSENPTILKSEGKEFSLEISSKNSYGSLKIACLLIGVGVGILLAFWVQAYAAMDIERMEAAHFYGIVELIYGGAIFIFGGLGLLLSFFLEMRFLKQEKMEKKEGE